LSNNENKELGLENLEGMLKILPDANEIELLKGYQGEADKLGEAEKFLYKLIEVPKYVTFFFFLCCTVSLNYLNIGLVKL
jgi:hypothetical protein